MERQFKGVWIPAEVWLNSDLTAIEKMLYAEIDSFTSRGSTFWKSNDTISEDMGVSVSTVKRSVAKLIEKGWVKQVKFDGRIRHLQADRVFHEPTESSNKYKQTAHIEPTHGSEVSGLLVQIEPLSKQKKVPREKPKRIDYPAEFLGEEFEEAWNTWKEYKSKEHNFKYKSPISEQTTIQKLHNETQGDPKYAIAAIGNAIARGWKGI